MPIEEEYFLIYPGADELILPELMIEMIKGEMSPDIKAKAYFSVDSPEKIKAWYSEQLSERGWKNILNEEEGVLYFCLWQKDENITGTQMDVWTAQHTEFLSQEIGWSAKDIEKLEGRNGQTFFLILGDSYDVWKTFIEDWESRQENIILARDARRQADIRQISLAMEMYYDGHYSVEGNNYPASEAMPFTIGIHLDPVPEDPLGYQYNWQSNVEDSRKYCLWAEFEQGGYFAASHKGLKELDEEPQNLDCW